MNFKKLLSKALIPFLALTLLVTPVLAGVLTGGGNVIIDGNMETAGVGDWSGNGTFTNNATPTKETTNPHRGTQVLRVTASGDKSVYQTVNPFVAGTTYRLTGWARSDGTVAPRLYNAGGTSLSWQGTTSTDWQYVDEIFTAGRSELQVRISATGYCEFDDLRVVEYGGTPTGQANEIANGRFANWTADDPDDWVITPEAGAYYITQVGNAARMVTDGTYYQITQSGVQDITKRYIVEFDILDVTAGQIRISNDAGGTAFNTVGHKTLIYTPNSADFGIKRGSGATDITFTNITVQELKGKPTGSATELVDGNAENAGVGDWTAYNTGVPTKETTDPHRGTQVLRVTKGGSNNGGVSQATGSDGNHRCYGYARGDATNVPKLSNGTTTYWTGTSSQDWQYFDEVLPLVSSSVFLGSNMSAAGYVEWDDVVCINVTL